MLASLDMIRYQQRQFGTTVVFALTGPAVVALGIDRVYPQHTPVLLLGVSLCLVGAILFWSLTVQVTDTQLRWSFGPGLIAKRVPLTEIAAVEVTRTTVWEGWGIHLTRRGWLYNVAGFGAVAIRLNSGKRFMLGSEEPEKLAAALQPVNVRA